MSETEAKEATSDTEAKEAMTVAELHAAMASNTPVVQVSESGYVEVGFIESITEMKDGRCAVTFNSQTSRTDDSSKALQTEPGCYAKLHVKSLQTEITRLIKRYQTFIRLLQKMQKVV